jgi:hypothetical protein
MRKAIREVDITQIPELLRLAQTVQDTQEPCVLKQGDQQVAMLTPVRASASSSRATRRRTPAFEPNDSLLKIAGIADAFLGPDAPTDVSQNKYKYLAEAYFPSESDNPPQP